MSLRSAALGIALLLCAALSFADSADEPLARTTQRGPVSATVSLTPAAPRIGDDLTLVLEAIAEPEVELLMPEFGEALDRFHIVDFAQRESVDADGRTHVFQTYTLASPMSGARSVPPLLVEFVDRRPGLPAAPEGEDAWEILTERLDFEVASVLPTDATHDLPAPPEALAPLDRGASARRWLVGGLVLLLGAALFAAREWRRRRAHARRASAHEIAESRLQALLERGTPESETEIDAFWVELSGIMRAYLEDRFDLHAPELTTEEFFGAARQSPDLTPELQASLGDFLQRADLVKFARHRPGPAEHDAAVTSVRNVLESTRPKDEDGSRRVTGWELRDPLFLLALSLAPLVFLLAARASSRVSYSSLQIVDRAPASWRARLAFLPAALLAVATALLAIALAGPRTGDATTTVHREGIAIALVVDRSGSMEARDFVADDRSVSRLDVVKRIVRQFVLGGDALGGRNDDLIGLVGFARHADALCPPTLDHLNLMAILDELQIPQEEGEDGTAVEGLALAVERLRRLEDVRSRLVILLTDGVNNSGEIEPLQAAQLAASHDIRVYAIGAGRTGRAPFPIRGPDGRIRLGRAYVELDEKTLKAIAQKTDGRYFHADSAEALERVYEEIDTLERSRVSEVRYLQYTEHYADFTIAALLCAALAALSGGTVFRRLP